MLQIKLKFIANTFFTRLQNSPSVLRIQVRASSQTKASGTRLKTESETTGVWGSRARRARKTLTPLFTDFFTDFEKKTDCFAVYFFTSFVLMIL